MAADYTIDYILFQPKYGHVINVSSFALVFKLCGSFAVLVTKIDLSNVAHALQAF